ncbi:MAG: peptidylprolyl isomerase [Rikenellaceae bacterium]|jgi:FKBP-type peptidyl-prolyl cis-trans isomerase SlyD|nr:peptidylprolyl isomerase [Rikenellaceae bacterium]
MKVAEKTFVSIAYTLTVDGEQVENVTAEAPLEFVFGAGFLLPAFEKNLEGLKKGEKFAFTLPAAEAYGEVIPEAVVELPKSVFMIDGKIEDGLLDVGNQLPMSDNQGNRMLGTIKAVSDEAVTMDFNHPMAGKTLNFTGEVAGVREATEEDLMHGQMAGGGCGCGCGEEECGPEGCNSEGCGCGN